MNPIIMKNLFFSMMASSAIILSGCQTETTAQDTIDQFSVSYDEASQSYLLDWQASDNTQPVVISVASSPEAESYQKIEEKWVGNSYRWHADDDNARHYFKVSSPSGSTEVSASRWLPLEGGRNFRDLGGYTTADGQQVRWGALFRTGAMDGLTDADYQLLKTFNIGTNVDFRTTEERQSEPTQWDAGKVDIMSWDYSMDMSGFGKVFSQPDLTPQKVEDMMASQYPLMLEQQKPHYKAMFERLAESDQGLVFNCTAGKDRTGIAGALILTALGVDRDTVVKDYMLSDVYYEKHGMAMFEDHADAPHNPQMEAFKKIPPELLKPLSGVRESYLKTTFEAMEAQSGSVMAYIQQELNVDDQKLQQIRDHFLVPVKG